MSKQPCGIHVVDLGVTFGCRLLLVVETIISPMWNVLKASQAVTFRIFIVVGFISIFGLDLNLQ